MESRYGSRVAGALVAMVALAGCAVQYPGRTLTPENTGAAPAPSATPSATAEATTLRTAAPQGFLVGAVVPGGGHHTTADYPDPFPNDQTLREQLGAEFSSLTPENQLKWDFVHPSEDTYNFAPADAIVEFAEANDQSVRGHTLVWHQQNPDWLPRGEISDDDFKAILHDHITTVVGHFQGRIRAWDVANEIFDENGQLRQDNPWIARFGVSIIADAFRWANEADPGAILYLNDYGVETAGPKQAAYLDLAQQLLNQGVPVGGFGFQGHLSMEYPFPAGLQTSLEAFANLGLEVAITELDIRIRTNGVASADTFYDEQAQWYADVFSACLAVTACTSVTLWGTADKYSWVSSTFPDQGAATPWTDDFTRKPAWTSIRDALSAGR